MHIVLVTSEIPLSKDTVIGLFDCRYVFKVLAVPFIWLLQSRQDTTAKTVLPSAVNFINVSKTGADLINNSDCYKFLLMISQKSTCLGRGDNVYMCVRAHAHTHTHTYGHVSLESDPIISCVIYVLHWAGFVFCFDGFCRIKLVCSTRDTRSHPILSVGGMVWYFMCWHSLKSADKAAH